MNPWLGLLFLIFVLALALCALVDMLKIPYTKGGKRPPDDRGTSE